MSLLPEYHGRTGWYQSVLLLELLLRIYGAQTGDSVLPDCRGRLTDGSGRYQVIETGGMENGYEYQKNAPYDEIGGQKSGTALGETDGPVDVIKKL